MDPVEDSLALSPIQRSRQPYVKNFAGFFHLACALLVLRRVLNDQGGEEEGLRRPSSPLKWDSRLPSHPQADNGLEPEAISLMERVVRVTSSIALSALKSQ
jgi:hypothetical protein